ncbi:MAG: family 43 glycosylhydrolase [Cytophagales bacterium]|nr:family 43 glycosylhydrolase [Cytophagales bacterium]
MDSDDSPFPFLLYWWYLTGTAYPHWSGAEQDGNLNPGIPLYRSKNLTDWEFVKIIVERPDSTKWYYRRFWAPEIHQINGKYYAILNCRNSEQGYDWQHIGYAVADQIEGPYTVVTENKPLARGNDLTFFKDDDGKIQRKEPSYTIQNITLER